MISKSLCNPLLNLCTPGDGIFQVPPLILSSPCTLFGGPLFHAVGLLVWLCALHRKKASFWRCSGSGRYPLLSSGTQACVFLRCQVLRETFSEALLLCSVSPGEFGGLSGAHFLSQ